MGHYLPENQVTISIKAGDRFNIWAFGSRMEVVMDIWKSLGADG